MKQRIRFDISRSPESTKEGDIVTVFRALKASCDYASRKEYLICSSVKGKLPEIQLRSVSFRPASPYIIA